ncbi:DUF6285 domain-containing protein [Mycobacterium sp.]|uniref:DUF6285 domain-containing protein n=1 Tax=Mycobacterium sp. TaxID=1785 RepID=UPI002CC0433C|nr:DUF6285 domain-containing protein [Mycobacterium sp.]HTQ15908.1 DUF6285 domain-containing protein [Mycobacterium sp.]
MTSGDALHGRPTAAELVATVAEFLEAEVHSSKPDAQRELAAAVEALRIVERQLLADPADDAASGDALAALGFSDEAQLAAAIRDGHLDDRADDVTSYLRTLVNRRLNVSHPGYQNE